MSPTEKRSAQMAELVDACVSGAHAARCAGSSPVLGTVIFIMIKTITHLFGAPENFNFWEEREGDENLHEQRSCESY